MAVPWAWAFDTPYKWTKQIPSFFGGTRNGMAISWPAKISDKGGIRNQLHHVIDIVPTILQATGLPAPVMVDGIAQKPIEGVSMTYTFDKANADAPTKHRVQYFEMFGLQGLYDDGWMLSAVPDRAPWDVLGRVALNPASHYNFELYDTRHDWTQYTDVAAANSDKVKEMTDLMFGEFAKYQVLPLDASVATRLVVPKPNLSAGRTVFTYSGEPVTGIPYSTAPNLLNTSYTITADIGVPQPKG
jgi:arylsulfatase